MNKQQAIDFALRAKQTAMEAQETADRLREEYEAASFATDKEKDKAMESLRTLRQAIEDGDLYAIEEAVNATAQARHRQARAQASEEAKAAAAAVAEHEAKKAAKAADKAMLQAIEVAEKELFPPKQPKP